MTSSDNAKFRTSWLAGASALLSVVACYGTLALIAVLSSMGITLAVNERVWAGVIVAFAVLAVLLVTIGFKYHQSRNPARLAIVAAALIIWAMYDSAGIRDMLGVPSMVVELAGFVGLLGAAYWDWKLRR